MNAHKVEEPGSHYKIANTGTGSNHPAFSFPTAIHDFHLTPKRNQMTIQCILVLRKRECGAKKEVDHF